MRTIRIDERAYMYTCTLYFIHACVPDSESLSGRHGAGSTVRVRLLEMFGVWQCGA